MSAAKTIIQINLSCFLKQPDTSVAKAIQEHSVKAEELIPGWHVQSFMDRYFPATSNMRDEALAISITKSHSGACGADYVALSYDGYRFDFV